MTALNLILRHCHIVCLGHRLVWAVVIASILIVQIGSFGITTNNLPDADAQVGCVPPPSGMVGWWPGDGDASDIADGNDGTLVNGATTAAGKVGQSFSFDGVDDAVIVPDSSSLDFSTGMDFSIDRKSVV